MKEADSNQNNEVACKFSKVQSEFQNSQRLRRLLSALDRIVRVRREMF